MQPAYTRTGDENGKKVYAGWTQIFAAFSKEFNSIQFNYLLYLLTRLAALVRITLHDWWLFLCVHTQQKKIGLFMWDYIVIMPLYLQMKVFMFIHTLFGNLLSIYTYTIYVTHHAQYGSAFYGFPIQSIVTKIRWWRTDGRGDALVVLLATRIILLLGDLHLFFLRIFCVCVCRRIFSIQSFFFAEQASGTYESLQKKCWSTL